MAAESAESPYDALGAHPGIRRAVDQFYRRIAADPTLVEYFAEADMERLHRHQVELLAAALGGPNNYTGRSMAKAHAGLHITNEAFDRVLGHLNATLVDVGSDEGTIRKVITALSRMRTDIVED